MLAGIGFTILAAAGPARTAGPVQNPDNGHWYEVVPGQIHWWEAHLQAQGRVYLGLPGHLATLTTQAEHDFVRTNLPEAQAQGFYLGAFQPRGSTEPAGGWTWVTGEPWSFTKWVGGQPDDQVGEDSRLAFSGGGDGWSDEHYWTRQAGYVVEYETAALAVPGAPGDLRAVGLSRDRIGVRWIDGSFDESSFQLERKSGTGAFNSIAALPAGSTSYTDVNLLPGITYSYRVRALNDRGASPYSNTAATTVASTVRVQNPANGHWYEGIDCGGALPWAAARAAADGLTYLGLQGHLVAITSDAENQFVTSNLPAAVGARAWLGAYQPPGSAEPAGGWTWVTGEPWAFTAWQGAEPNDLLNEEHVLHFASAAGWNDASEVSDDIAAFIVEYEGPSPPDGLTATHVSTSRIDLTWIDTRTDETGFEIQRRSGASAFALIATVPANATSYTDTGLTANRLYTYRVRALTPGGPTAYSNEASADTSPTITLAPAVNFPVPLPHTIRSSDFDSDGHLDLVAYSEGNASILFGRGDGTFDPAVHFGVGTSFETEWAYVTGEDVNRDGRPDILAAVGADDSLVVRLNTGSRTFAAPVSYAAGDLPRGLTVADFNGDGWPDVAVSNHGSRNLSVHLNRGDGTFAAAVLYPSSGGNPGTITSADYNGDGKCDLAMTHYISDDVRIYLGNGRGGFTPGAIYPMGSYPASIITGDFNGDGFPDLATQNDFGHNVAVLFNDGSGQFAHSPFYPTSSFPRQLGEADFDLDGDLDLAVPTSGSNLLNILANRGDGVFGTVLTFPSGGVNMRSLTTGDFNEDGLPDIANSNEDSSNVSVYLNTTAVIAVPPEAPTGLTATAVSPHQVNLAWVDNSLSESGFRIDRRTTASGEFGEISQVSANVTSFQDLTAAPDTTYVYRVRARGPGGDAASNEVSVTTPKALPTAPSGLSALSISSSRIDLAWTDNSSDEESFEIERKTSASGYALVGAVGQNVAAFSDEGLDPETQYTYRVRAVNASGGSTYASPASAMTRGAPPTGVSLDVLSDTSIRVRWTDASSGETGFKVERKIAATASLAFTVAGTVGPNVTQFVDTGLLPQTAYIYRVRVTNAGGDSDPSEEVTASTLNAPTGKLILPKKVNFGRAKLGASVSRKLLVRNGSSTSALRVILSNPSLPFGLTGAGQTVELAPGGQQSLTLTFAPRFRGKAAAKLDVRSTDPARPAATVQLLGSGR